MSSPTELTASSVDDDTFTPAAALQQQVPRSPWWLAATRWSIAVAIGLVAAVAAARLAFLDGWLRTVRIEGASMAAAHCGRHWLVTCSDCGFAFRCDAEELPASGTFVCPNCGQRELGERDAVLQAGDKVLLDRWPLLWSPPKRGDVVAAENPLEAGMTVKRVAGLPGERIAIRGGDLYADGKIVRKSLAEFRQVAVLVHDNDFLPKNVGPHDGFLRWRPTRPTTSWQAAGDDFRWDSRGGGNAADEWDELEYVHFRCDGSHVPRTEPAAILDNDSYNQGLSRRLNVVRDLLLECQMRLGKGARLRVILAALGDRFHADLGNGRVALVSSERTLSEVEVRSLRTNRDVRLEVGAFDGQFVLALDGKVVTSEELSATEEKDMTQSSRSRVTLAAGGGPVEIAGLRVWRDQYLLEPRGTAREWSLRAPLGKDEYFLIGDNVPASIDSRHWGDAGLARRKLRGLVLTPRRK